MSVMVFNNFYVEICKPECNAGSKTGEVCKKGVCVCGMEANSVACTDGQVCISGTCRGIVYN